MLAPPFDYFTNTTYHKQGDKSRQLWQKKKNFFHGSQCRASTSFSYAELTIFVVILSTIRDSVIVDS